MHLMSNLYGPNNVWVPKGTCWTCRTMEMHWRLGLLGEILYLKMQPSASQHWRNIYFNGISIIKVNRHIFVTFSSLWTKVCHYSCSCEILESNFDSISSYSLLCACDALMSLKQRICLMFEMQKTMNTSFVFKLDKISKAMLDWRWYLFWSELTIQGRNFRSSPEVSSLLRSRVLGNQDYFCQNFRPSVGTSD